MKRLLARWNPFSLFQKVYYYCKRNGFRRTVQRVLHVFRFRSRFKRRAVYSKADLWQQRKRVFAKEIRISILVPLYHTPLRFLRAMIDSVLAQTYQNWELCLADGSDADRGEVETVVLEYAQKDARIRYRRLEKNGGISENTNACAAMASGDYLALFDHDDLLHPAALYEVMCAICDQGADFIYTDEVTFFKKPSDAYGPNFKPDYAPDTLRSYNYICHLCVFEKTLFDAVGGFRAAFDGSQDYDLILRLTERANKIVHVPKILYYWRCHKNSVSYDISAKPYTVTSAMAALREHLQRLGLQGKVEEGQVPTTYRLSYEIEGNPLVSVIIVNKDHADALAACIRSVLEKSTYPNYEILIVENNSAEEKTFAYYDKICAECDKVRILRYEGEYNASKINNFALPYANGTQIIFLHNDIEIITPAWIEEMLMYTQRSDVGAAGMMLYYPDNTIQHAGVIVGLDGAAGYSHKNFRKDDLGYLSRLVIAQNLSAVTAAAIMVKKSVLDEVTAFEEDLGAEFGGIDLCLEIRKAGYLIVFTPFAQAYHHEPKAKRLEESPEARKRFCEKWEDVLAVGDPYYNPNLTLDHEDFRIK